MSAALALALLLLAQQLPLRVGEELPYWTPGTLDIHQLATGRGNAAFLRLPDGTTLLLDAGDAGESANGSPRPEIARYVRRMLGDAAPRLDYVVLTHFHRDHVGGLADVARELEIRRVIDRGSAYLKPENDATFDGYRRLLAERGLEVQAAQAGSAAQLVAAGVEVRVVAVNDRVWTGRGDETKVRFPPLVAIPLPEDRPTENMCSVALRLRYGRFDWWSGGDMPGYPVPGGPAWHDLESDVARAIGPVDVHVVSHHGSIEVENPFWLERLRSRVMVLPAWSATHPSPDVLKRMLSRRLYPGPRDVFVTLLRDATKAAIGARAGQVASDHGHVVVRVEPGGGRYFVIVLDETRSDARIRSLHGPYASE
jgi:beta-lactamase superfamily II metal-dependent hydrolase